MPAENYTPSILSSLLAKHHWFPRMRQDKTIHVVYGSTQIPNFSPPSMAYNSYTKKKIKVFKYYTQPLKENLNKITKSGSMTLREL